VSRGREKARTGSNLPDKSKNDIQNLIRVERIGMDVYFCMLAGVPEPVDLVVVLGFHPIKGFACYGNRVRDVQVYKNLWIDQAQPHIGNIGVFLGDVISVKP